jgi:ribosome-binding protein aMBF1 (putative translation factor)
MRENRYVRTLERARELAGGHEQLAAALHTSPEVLAKWFSGELVPPTKAFMAALELVSRSITEWRKAKIRRPTRA